MLGTLYEKQSFFGARTYQINMAHIGNMARVQQLSFFTCRAFLCTNGWLRNPTLRMVRHALGRFLVYFSDITNRYVSRRHEHKRLDFLPGCFLHQRFVFVLAMHDETRKELP
ncbi:hypothetical protein EVAR_62548_1 [Eumeta japonica]|uniref:Uncharacterized protein n=1 Tax=Eumeta variegata TaxID=151549 RepID=A0A4C1YWK9_EUMVA|nr:hypothetical protein EVAR_62548_1 [Eumeta japonica]